MAILLVAATELEIAEMQSKAGDDLEILITGIGSVATCYHLSKALESRRYSLIIQAGIAGTFNDNHQLADVVVVKQDCFGDLGIEENGTFLPINNTSLANANAAPFSNGFLINEFRIAGTEDLERVKAVTVNKVSDSEVQKEQLIVNFNPDIESMEGAGFFYVALQHDTPFVQLRSISNYVGDRNKANWKMKDAKKNLCSVIDQVIEKNLRINKDY
jgi:futalosine hydrolase